MNEEESRESERDVREPSRQYEPKPTTVQKDPFDDSAEQKKDGPEKRETRERERPRDIRREEKQM